MVVSSFGILYLFICTQSMEAGIEKVGGSVMSALLILVWWALEVLSVSNMRVLILSLILFLMLYRVSVARSLLKERKIWWIRAVLPIVSS